MDQALYIKLTAQVARQTVELAALDADVASRQPAIDAVQSDVNAAQAASDAAPENTGLRQALDSAKQALASFVNLRDIVLGNANAIRASIAQCSALLSSGGMTMTAGEISAQNLSSAITKLVAKIDRDVDDIYDACLGKRGPEYALAESDALSFSAGGYAGAAPPSVSSWAAAKGWTTTQAANDILAAATNWRNAQTAIRSQRLAKKELAKIASDIAAVQTVSVAWVAFRSGIRAALGLPV
jgi:hypothetical protein